MKHFLVIVLAFVLVLPLGLARAEEDSLSEEFFDLLNLDTRDDGGVYTLMDQEGSVLMRTGRHIHSGDTWIGMDNRKWEVYEIDGDNAYARSVSTGKDQSLLDLIQAAITTLFPGTSPAQEEENVERKIGVYNTHGAEAYVPDDGTDSVPEGGGIINVAESLTESLRENGVDVIQSKETHVPHDAGAYKRSRETVGEMMGEGVDAVVDVHRDAVAAEEYEANGMVQVQLVVGRQNQNQATNQQFAEELKAIADEKYPGLVKGIFSAKGNYNQDMSPTSILVEVGTHETEKDGAQEAAAKFADVLSIALYGTAEAAESPTKQPQSAARGGGNVLRTILWLLAIVIVGGGIFLYVSAGSWPEMKRKLQGFTKGEFGDLFKARVKNRGDDDELK